MSSVQVNDRIIVDIMPFVYKVTRIISPTEFVVLNTYQNTEHKVEYSGNGWKFSGVDIPHQFNKVGYLISPPIIPRQPSPPRTIPLSTITESMRLRPTVPTPTLGLTPQPIISRPTIATPTLGLTPPPVVSRPTIATPLPGGLVGQFGNFTANPNLLSTYGNSQPTPTIGSVPQPSRINPFAGPISLPTPIIPLPTNTNQPLISEMERRGVLSYDDWLEYVYNNHLTITWDQFQTLPDDTLIVPGIEQGPFIINEGLKPADLYFQDQLTTIGDIGRDNFYEYEGYAVLGSGTDNSILQSDLARTPLIDTNIY
jgi:hypothetical protein